MTGVGHLINTCVTGVGHLINTCATVVVGHLINPLCDRCWSLD